MLIDYTTDTKEEDLHPNAIEIRKRVAGRKLIEAIEYGVVSNQQLNKFKNMNRHEREQQLHESFEVSRAGISERTALVRAEQQLEIQASLRNLNRDITRASRLGKAKIDVLSDLEKRIIKMRAELKEVKTEPAETELTANLRDTAKSRLAINTRECPTCRRMILSDLLETHKRYCTIKDGTTSVVVNNEANADPEYQLAKNMHAKFRSLPPRNFRVVNKGSDFIHWEWDPPIMDGGLPVFDYQIRFTSVKHVYDEETKLTKTSLEKFDFMTSRWCLTRAVRSQGYRISQLHADRDYLDFETRVKNEQGWSDWISMTGSDVIRTEPAMHPHPPLFFACVKVTSTCLHVTWEPPFFKGGVDITMYVINYTVTERIITATSRGVLVGKHMSLKVPRLNESNQIGGTECFIIRNIPLDTEVSNISIVAVNASNLSSERAELKGVIRTQQGSRYSMILQELIASEAVAGDFIDTDFFTGVQQRLRRQQYLQQLKQALQRCAPTDEEADETAEWTKIMEIKNEKLRIEKEIEDRIRKDELSNQRKVAAQIGGVFDPKYTLAFTPEIRRGHYKIKLAKLENQIKMCDDETQFLNTERSRFTEDMRDKQHRMMLLKVERDRLSNFQDEYVISSVIHGYDVKYMFADFLNAVEVELEACQTDIATAKHKIHTGEKRKSELKVLLHRSEEELKHRKAEFYRFEYRLSKSFDAHTFFKGGLAQLTPKQLKVRYYSIWRDFVEARAVARRRATKTFTMLVRNKVVSAFMKWAYGHFDCGSHESEAFFGAGSKLLQKAKEDRADLQAALRHVIASTSSVKKDLEIAAMSRGNRIGLLQSRTFKEQEEGQSIDRLLDKGLHYLFEGDGYARQGRFDLAKDAYESQVLYLRSLPILDIPSLAMAHGRIGRVCMLMQKIDRAIVEFDRQLSLAKEVDDKVQMGDAYFGLGYGYMKNSDFEASIRFLDRAQGYLLPLKHATKLSTCYKALRDCFKRLQKTDAAKIYEDKASVLDNELELTVQQLHGRFDAMKERLVVEVASAERVVKMQRTSYKALTLRNELRRVGVEVEETEDLMQKQDELIKKVVTILDAIQKELKEAHETDELEVWSSLVHDQAQLVDVEELKTRLEVRQKLELANLDRENQEKLNLETRLRNLDDSASIMEADLSLEEGVLLSKCREDKPFRCVAFCAANAAGDEVTGTLTGGVENFATAEGNNIHLIDYHTGELLHIFIGDDKNRLGEKVGHTGVVTCLVHDESFIYSGSADTTIMSWRLDDRTRALTISGHEGTIVSLAVDGPYLCSGSADCTLRLWDKATGDALRLIHGHSKSVLAMEMGPGRLVTASADEEVRVWSIERRGKATVAVETVQRLIGHEAAVTAVRFGTLEVVSGDRTGRIFIWWLQTAQILRICKVHEGLVKSIQFDAVQIVSGGVDRNVCVTDIATGCVLQTIRGHHGHVLAVAFDSERIISAGNDNKICYWKFGMKAAVDDKMHRVNHSETLNSIARKFEISLEDLMLWNGITDVRRQFYVGLNLIVKKGDPDQLTRAEKLQIERKRKNDVGLGYSEKDAKYINVSGSRDNILKYRRVHRNAMDTDKHSIGNRLFRDAKQKVEMFPDVFDPNNDPFVLARRLQRNDEHADAQLDARRRSGNVTEEVFITVATNEEEWGNVADSLGNAMFGVFLDYAFYEIATEQQRGHNNEGMLGRIRRFNDAEAERKKAEETEAEAEVSRLKEQEYQRQHDGVGGDSGNAAAHDGERGTDNNS